MRWSEDSPRFYRSATMRERTAESRETFEFPSATQALRTRPRHFARLTALLRKVALNSFCVRDASHSSSGAKSVASACVSSFLFLDLFSFFVFPFLNNSTALFELCFTTRG